MTAPCLPASAELDKTEQIVEEARERWHIPSCPIFWFRGTPSDWYPEQPITQDPLAEDFGSLNIICGHVFTDGKWRHSDQGSPSPPLWLRRGLGPGQQWHSQHAGRQTRYSAWKNFIRGQGGTPRSGRRPPAVRESYTASSHLVRLHVCDQRVCQGKTEETPVPRGPLEGLLEFLRCHLPASLGSHSLEESRQTSWRRWAHYVTQCPSNLWQAGKDGRLGKPQAFHFDASAFWSLEGSGRRQESHVSQGVKLGFIGHAYDQNERLREGKDKWQEGVKSNFRTSRIVLVKYMSSVCALTEDIYKHLKFDKRHPVLASIQCHSNTTISPAMLNSTLTVHIHSNTTISAAILAPPLPARLLQYANVNSLASSLGRKFFRSRSRRIWCRTESMPQVLPNGGRGRRRESRRNHQHESRRKTTSDGLPMAGIRRTDLRVRLVCGVSLFVIFIRRPSFVAQACGSEHKTRFVIIVHHRFIWRPLLFFDRCWCVGGSSITILPLLVHIFRTSATLENPCSVCAGKHVTVSRYCRFCTSF